jgi:hypothetical protein
VRERGACARARTDAGIGLRPERAPTLSVTALLPLQCEVFPRTLRRTLRLPQEGVGWVGVTLSGGGLLRRSGGVAIAERGRLRLLWCPRAKETATAMLLTKPLCC